MNIKIIDSWLREYLKTKAKPKEIAEKLSLTSVSVEKIEEIEGEHVYDIEVTANRPDLMSVIGIAREAAAVLPRFDIEAKLEEINLEKIINNLSFPIEIIFDPKIVNRICAVVMEVEVKDSPKTISDRLEKSGIRSLNNLIDITNYVMREIGHPCHVFDLDRLNTDKIIIRESKPGEKVVTLDKKSHILKGGDIIADNGKGEIVDILGVMGTDNSIVNDKTKRILFFIDNNEPYHIRKTSMSLGERTEAAILNEKGVDTELAMTALIKGIELYKENANGKVISKILDVYPNKPSKKIITITKEKLDKITGIEVSLKLIEKYLPILGFKVVIKGSSISVEVPSFRNGDILDEEDIIEEIARLFGYHNLPSILPPLTKADFYNISKDEFYWEKRVKNLMKYWGFTEVYTYSLVSESLLEVSTDNAVKLLNPLSEDMQYLRATLVPSLLTAASENSIRDELKIFEISNVYIKKVNDLPNEVLKLAGVIKRKNVSFFEGKGIVEQLFKDLGIKEFSFKESEKGGVGATVFIEKNNVGEIEVLDDNTLDFELDFLKILEYVSLAKNYNQISKYPPIVEDLAIVASESYKTGELISFIEKQSHLIVSVTVLDIFENTRTFHIVYQSKQRNLTTEEVGKIRNQIVQELKKEFNAEIK